MRVRDHLVLSAAGAALVSPLGGREALGLWAGGVLIDVDHYAWFCVRQRSLSPSAAVAFFNAANPPQHSATRLLHSPAALLAVLIAGIRYRQFRAVALGMGLHVALDAFGKARMDAARSLALERDQFSCRSCGAGESQVRAHVLRQPWLLPSYQTQNLISLCGRCHEAVHAHGSRPGRCS